MAWLSDWGYRKTVPVGAAAGAGTNCQVRFKAHYNEGMDCVSQWNSGSIDTSLSGDFPRNIIIEGGYLYGVTNDQKQLVIYDVSSIDSPVMKSQTTMARRGCDIRYKEVGSDKYLFISSDSGVAVWDVTDPINPVEDNHLSLQHASEDAHVHGMFLDGDYLYCCHHRCDRFTIVDVSDPTSPVEKGYLEGSTYFNGCHDCYVEGNYAYVTNYLAGSGQYGFTVVDISDKDNPSLEGYTCANTQFSHITKKGNFVFVGSHGPSTTGWHVIDVSTPSSPSLDGSYWTADGNYGYWMDWWDANTIVAATNKSGVRYISLIDVSNPSSPSRIVEESFSGIESVLACVHVNSGRIFASGSTKSGATYYWHIMSFSVSEVYFEGHCRTDFGDVRFTHNDGQTELAYFIEEKVDGDYAIFWVKVTDDISSSDTQIYAYYGKPSATTTSNIENTFILGDDFPGSSLDAGKWDSDGAVSVSGGECTLTNDARISSKATYAGGYAILARIKTGTDTVGAWFVSFTDDPTATTNKYHDWVYYSSSLSYFRFNSGDGTNYATKDSIVPRDTNYHVFEIQRTGSADKFSCDDKVNINGDYPTNNSRYVLVRAFSADAVIYWIAVRKYVDPEPAIGIAGNEQTPTVGWTGIVNGVTNPAKVMGIDVANIAKVHGVA